MTLAGSSQIQRDLGGSTLIASITVPFYFELGYDLGWIQLDLGGSTLLTSTTVPFYFKLAYDPGWIRLDPVKTGRIHLID